ncbi:uncharacterized protein BDV17DRAFT_250559 [Aspergillus undulatus]|uniref:uncharacterized protein n=1 Tax=Aspergillus undulatus TaxID=1810928 RepID=UPI003CCDDF70
MILIRQIPGVTMVDIQPKELPQSTRQFIMKSIVDLESRIYEKDVWLVDVEPRNIIIASPASKESHVIFIDLAHALINRRRDELIVAHLNYFLGQYMSPILRWENSRRDALAFKEWID